MPRRSTVVACVAVLLAGGLVFAVHHLMRDRVERGDVFQPYSTYRSDPLGTAAFYESLGLLPGLRVSRNIQPVDKVLDRETATFFYLAIDAGDYTGYTSEDEARSIESFAARGGRVVITMRPQRLVTSWDIDRADRLRRWREERDARLREKEEKADTEPKKSSDKKGNDEEKDDKTNNDKDKEKKKEEESLPSETLVKRWGVSLEHKELAKSTSRDGYAEALAMPVGRDWKPLPWQTVNYFKTDNPKWEVIATRDGHPVVLEWKVGDGSIVLSTDTYLLSNEAVWRQRHPEFLAWLAGGNEKILFDESHFGTAENPGVATLARRYHLEGVALAFLVLAGLFIWRNASSLIPRREVPPTGEVLIGRDGRAGFVNLLRRSVAPADLLAVCHAEWLKTAARTVRTRDAKAVETLVAVEQAKEPGKRLPVTACHQIQKILNQRKTAQG